MKNLLFGLIGITIAFSSQAQVSGNSTWNENNRFKMNATYENRSFAAPMANQAQINQGIVSHQWNLGDNKKAQQGTYSDANNTNLTIQVLKNAEPTGYTAIFHMNQAGEKIVELDSKLTKRVRKFITMGKDIGLKPENFYVDMIALVPIFRKEKKLFSSAYIEVPKGFEMQKNIHVRYDKPEQLDRLFTIAAQCEIYDLIKVEYHYDSTHFAKNQMRKAAISILNERMKSFKELKVNLDTCYRIVSENTYQVDPVDQYVNYQPMAVSAISDDNAEETAKRPNRSTLFHNRISGNSFDAVINPNPLEPSIQMVYTMNVSFTRKIPVNTVHNNTVKTKMMIITPNGGITERWVD